MKLSKKWLIATWLSVVIVLSGIGISYQPEKQEKLVITLGSVAEASVDLDYTFDGVDDNVQFQAALNALPATGGKLVVVSATTINFGATVTRAIPNVTIEGSGLGSYFANDGGTALFTAGGNGWTFKDLRTDAGGINMGATTGWTWIKVNNGTTAYDLRTPEGSIVNGVYTASNLYDSALTENSVPYIGASGLITDSTNLTFDVDTGTFQVSGANVTRSVTYVVAAYDSPDSVKAQADKVCDNVTGGADIQSIINEIEGRATAVVTGSVLVGSPVTLSPGINTLNVTGNGTLTVTMTGSNQGYAASGTSTVTSSPVLLNDGDTNITVTGAGTITMTDAGGIGGTIKFSEGTFDWSDQLVTIKKRGIHLIGSAGTRIQSDLLPALVLDGSAYKAVPLTLRPDGYQLFNDIVIENIYFKHTGTPAAGSFITASYLFGDVGGLNASETSHNNIIWRNVNIVGSSYTTVGYYGLTLDKPICSKFYDLQVNEWYIGVLLTNDGADGYETGNNDFYGFQAQTIHGGFYTATASDNGMVFYSPKIQSIYNAGYGIKFDTNISPISVVIVNPTFETWDNTSNCIYSKALNTTILGGSFAGSTSGSAIVFTYGANPNIKASVTGSSFTGTMTRAISTGVKTNLSSNFFANTLTDDVYINDANGYIIGDRWDCGWISAGQIYTYTGTIGTLTQNAYNSIDNPFGQSVRVLSLDIYVSTNATATTPNIDCGIGSSATTDYTNLFNDLPGETIGFYNSVNTATTGNQTSPILWQSGSGNRYLNMSIKDAAATGMVATYVITIMGN